MARDGDASGSLGSEDALLRCRFCGKNLERYFVHAPAYCPYCGGAINPSTMQPKLSKDSNSLTGRALWSTKISIVGVLLGMALLIGIGVLVTMVILAIMLLAYPAGLDDLDGLIVMVETVLLNPVGFALLAVAEFILIVPPLVFLKKYRNPVKERFQLLGWRPYDLRTSFQAGARRFTKDLGLSAIIAAGLVGFQFLLIILNDIAWSPVFPDDVGFPVMDTFIGPSNVIELTLLISVMMLVIGPAEEILYRGFAQQGLEANLGEKRALLITALLFTFSHVIPGLMPLATTLYMLLPYLALSLVFCGLYTRTKDLNILVLVHGLYDSMLVVYMFLVSSDATVVAGIVMAIACIVVLTVLSFIVVGKHVRRGLMARHV